MNNPTPQLRTSPQRSAQRRSAPWLDRTLGNQLGRLLAWLGKRALRRGDRHEFNHILAAVLAGNSQHCTPQECTLTIHRPDQSETNHTAPTAEGATP